MRDLKISSFFSAVKMICDLEAALIERARSLPTLQPKKAQASQQSKPKYGGMLPDSIYIQISLYIIEIYNFFLSPHKNV
jgi:hypothetical protein